MFSIDCVMLGKGIKQEFHTANSLRCNVNKISDCQFMCQKHPGCKAFQYAPFPGLTNSRAMGCSTGECYLATEYVTEINPKTYAGPKYCGKLTRF